MCCLLGALLAAAAAAAPETITSLAQLNQLPGDEDSRVAEVDVEGTVWWSNQLPDEQLSRVASVKIEGTVWWSDATEGRVILKDDTAVVQLELDFPCRIPDMGDRLVLEGDCKAIKTTDVIKLSGVPAVDNDGLHPPEEKSGTLYLTAGRHPVRIQWFNRTDRYGLELEVEGPALPRQKVSGDMLFRLQADPETGSTNFVNGLDYRCYEGEWWRFLPNFDHLTAVRTGVVDNFDIAVRSRDNHVGLMFSGFIEVPGDGMYTFHLLSDDGSRMFIGPSSLRAVKKGTAPLPAPQPAAMEEIPSDESAVYQWSEIEGTVTSFHHLEQGLELDLMTQIGVVRLEVAEDSDSSYILRPQNRIRGVGVSRRIHKLDGNLTRGEFFVQKWDDIEQHYVTPKIWTEYPLVEIGTLLTMDPSGIMDSVVHIKGRFLLSEDGESVVLEDDSGRLVMDDVTVKEYIPGAVDVLGRVWMNGTGLTLRCTHYRSLGEDGTGSGRLPVLTTAEQVCQLSYEEAARGYPVQVKGVIISILDYNGAVLHDSSRGIYMFAGSPIPLQVGDYCDIEGVTGPFGFDPYIQVTEFQKLGKGILPEPIQPTRDQLISGTLHCNFVELEGVVASIQDDTIVLLTRDGRINVRLNPIGADMPPDTVGATVRLRGCLLHDWDGETRRVVLGSLYLDQYRVTVVHPAPADPFDIPLKHIGDLLQFDPQAGALQRVKVSGQLIHRNAEMAYLMDEEHGLRFVPMEGETAVVVGDQVEVVGFSDLSGPSPLLRDAVFRRVRASEPMHSRDLEAHELLRDEYDSTLVRVRGVLLGVSTRMDGSVLEMQSGHRRFMAVANDQTGLAETLKPGSRLELTGVYVGQGGNRVLGRPIDSFQLLLNSGRDVLVLSRPPWWTLKRLFLVVSLLIGVLLAALIWINLLHRQVDERTEQLGEQIRQRQRIEQQREIEQERARLAGNLHDDLGAGLTEVNMLTTLIKSRTTSGEEKEHYANKLNELALRMVTSLDEIVWAQNPRNDTLASLAGYFGAYAQRLLELASVGCGLDVADDLPEISLDPKYRQELFLAFKEALTNVIKHADAAKVWLRIQVRDHTLMVSVSDDGSGMLPERREVGEDGLSNMQKRLDSLGGHCEIDSHPGKGTTVRFAAPIGKETA
jgi:signal transduction histidine kinase